MEEPGEIIRSGLPVAKEAEAMQKRLMTSDGTVSPTETPAPKQEPSTHPAGIAPTETAGATTAPDATPTTVFKKGSKKIPPIKFGPEGDPRLNMQFPQEVLDLPPADFSDLKPRSPIGLTGTPAMKLDAEKPGMRERAAGFFRSFISIRKRLVGAAEPTPVTPEVVNQAAGTTTEPPQTTAAMTADERARLGSRNS